jgi:hypothetical protein
MTAFRRDHAPTSPHHEEGLAEPAPAPMTATLVRSVARLGQHAQLVAWRCRTQHAA